MKKLIALVLVLMLCGTAFAATVDWSSMTDDEINAEIEETRLNINALEVAIECAVTIEQAQQWAKAHNMQYPLQSQYVVS